MSIISGLGTMARHRHFRTRTESKSRDTAAGYWYVLIVLACAVFILSSAPLSAATPVATRMKALVVTPKGQEPSCMERSTPRKCH